MEAKKTKAKAKPRAKAIKKKENTESTETAETEKPAVAPINNSVNIAPVAEVPREVLEKILGNKGETDLKEKLLALLKKEIPQCFEREPTAGWTGHLNKVVDMIISLR